MSSVDQFPSKGYLYIVCGPRKYLEEAKCSVRSLRQCDPEAHVTLITDGRHLGREQSVFDHQVVIGRQDIGDTWKTGLQYKISTMYACSPYEETFFVDTDTYFIENCRCLFDLLDYNDLCLAHSIDESTLVVDGSPLTGYTPYNTGVILFKERQKTERFFKVWKRVWQEGGHSYPYGQPAFMEALLYTSCRIYILRNNWNARFIFPEVYSGHVKLLHGRHDDLSRIAERINVTDQNRSWLPEAEACVHLGMGASEALRILPVIAQRVLRTIDRDARNRIGHLLGMRGG